MVPVALAYAGLAGVPPELVLVTAFAALAAYAVFGTSRHLKVTVSSTMAIMSAAVVADLATGDPATYVALTSALALIVGAILIAGGILRLGFISDFLAKSVITGFIFGLAITIIVGQIPKLLGVAGVSGTLPEQLVQLAGSLSDTNKYTLAIGLISLAIILILRVIARRIPGPLIVLVLGILLGTLVPLAEYGVSTVGDVATGIPTPGLPGAPLSALPFLALGAIGIVFLAVGESVGTARAYAGTHHYEIDADQELLGLGASNLASALFGGFTTDASLSQTATAEFAGTMSQLSSLVTSALILATAIFLAPLFANLPNAVLGAIVIAAVIGLMDVPEMQRYWKWRHTDFFIAVTAMVGVLLHVGPCRDGPCGHAECGVRAVPRQPAVRGVAGPDAGHARDLRGPQPPPGCGAGAGVDDHFLPRCPAVLLQRQRRARPDPDPVNAQDPPPLAVLIDMAATADLDVTTADMLRILPRILRGRSIQALLAQVKGKVRDRLRKTDLMPLIGEHRIYLSIGAGVEDFIRRTTITGDDDDGDPWGDEEDGDRDASDDDAADEAADADAGADADVADDTTTPDNTPPQTTDTQP